MTRTRSTDASSHRYRGGANPTPYGPRPSRQAIRASSTAANGSGAVVLEHPPALAPAELLGDRGVERLDERRDMHEVHGQAGGRPVPAEPPEQRRAGAQGRVHVDLAVRAHRTAGLAAGRVEREDHGGSAVAADHAGRGDADDAVQPPVVADDDAVAVLAARVGGEDRQGLADDRLLVLAAVAVDALDALGHRPRLGGAAGPQQAQRRLGRAEAAGRVDPRAEAKAEVGLVDRLVDADAGVLEQRAQAGAVALTDHVEAAAHEDPVLRDQRDHVAHRPERDQVEPARAGRAGRSSTPTRGRSSSAARRTGRTRRRRCTGP
jgi:hypothetical protein